jgi:arsenate reductase
MCTGNSCRSIISEALINAKLDGIKAYSCGTKPSGRVNHNARKVLEQHNIWIDKYHSKHIDEVIDIDFDLIITVCDNAKKSCPTSFTSKRVLHIGFEDLDGGEYKEFETTYNSIKKTLLPKISKEFGV